MPPQFAGMTQLYSVEFYESCRDAMRENGIVCQWLPLHLVTREQGLAMMRAMAEVFATVQYWEHAENGMLIGTMRPQLGLDRSTVARLGNAPAARQDLEQGGIQGIAELSAAYVCDASDLLVELQRVEPIRDDHPGLEYATISHGLRYPSAPELARRQEPFYRAALTARLPLSGFEQDAGIRGYVLSLAIERYTRNLLERGEPARALEFLRGQIRANPDLPLIDRLQLMLEEGERAQGL